MRHSAPSTRFLAFVLGTGLFLGLAQLIFPAGPGVRPGAAPSQVRSAVQPANPTAEAASLPAARAQFESRYSRLPLAFEKNTGQNGARVLYLSRGLGYTLFLTPGEEVLALNAPGRGTSAAPQESLALGFVGASPSAIVSGVDELPAKTNYFLGRDAARWVRNVPNYAKVTYSDVYAGVDLVFYGTQRQLEQDWIVSPGANPSQVAFEVRGAKGIALDPSGALRISLASGEVRLLKPVAYQQAGERTKTAVEAAFTLKGGNVVGFKLGAYDASRALIIDPVLAYSTYLGGSGFDEAHAVAVDSSGDIFVAGDTASTDFVTTGAAYQTSCALDINNICERDAFVTEFAADGATEIYSTYLGGSGSESTFGLAVDSSGNAYVTGQTTSTLDFPFVNGYQDACNTAGYTTSCLDAFVSKISSDGSTLLYSTYLGGSGADSGNAIAVDASGNAYVAGQTSSIDFPTTPGVIQTTCGTDANCNASGGIGQPDAFVAELATSGGSEDLKKLHGPQGGSSSLAYSTYLGGSGTDYGLAIALDANGDAFVAGSSSSTDLPATAGVVQAACKLDTSSVCEGEPFVAQLNPTATALNYLTYLGGSGGNGDDTAYGLALDASGNAYVAGQTASADFPVTAGAYQTLCGTDGTCNASGGAGIADGFVAKLNSTATALIYSTFLGGSGLDLASGIAVDSTGTAYVSGGTYSVDFPAANAIVSGTALTGGEDAFVAALNSTGTALVFSTYLGGTGNDVAYGIALDSAGDAFVAGSTASADFPTLNPFQAANAGQTDAFVAELAGTQAAIITLSANSLTFASYTVGTTSVSQAVTVTNTGNASLLVSSVTLGGANPADFAVTLDTCTGATVAPAGTCEIDADFTPSALGTRTASISVASNASNGTQTVTLTGTGIAKSVTLTPPVLSYASQIVGTSSAAQTATLTNTGTETVTITSISISGANSGDFTDTTTCGETLAAGTSCSVSVTFAPTAGGTRTATLSVSDDAGGSPQTVALTGQGSDFAILLQYDLPNVTIPPGQTAVYELLITPLGGFNNTVNVSCSGAPNLATCTVNPSSITPTNGVTPVKVSVDVATTAPTFAPVARHRVPPLGPMGGRLLVLGGLMLGALAFLARRRKAAIALAFIMLFVVAWASCGSNSIPTVNHQSGTPSGTYTITVTATSGSLTHSTTGTLIVQ